MKTRPSKTACKVALSIVALGEEPEMKNILPSGAVEATAKLLVASGAVSAAMVRLARSSQMGFVYKLMDWILPGQFEAFAYRKAFCERQVRDGINSGATQVLSLGAGYDTMGYRLATRFPSVNFFEVDRPDTVSFKASGIDTMGRRPNLFLIPEDLRALKLVDIMGSSEVWDQAAQTVIIAEGLLMYLPPIVVRELFSQCSAIVDAGSRIAFTYVTTGLKGLPEAGRWSRLVLWVLKLGGEPWLWSIRQEELDLFLEETGWTNAIETLGTSVRHGVECFGVALK